MMGYMELLVIAAIAFLVRRPAYFAARLLAWIAVGVAIALTLLSVATGVPVPTGVLVVTLITIVGLRSISSRRGTLRRATV